jgi:hypothetical protein
MDRSARTHERVSRAAQRSLRLLEHELKRLNAEDVQLSLDGDFEPSAGTLLKVEVGLAFWHLPIDDFNQLISEIPDGCGGEAIKRAIETHALHVWHGPSPTQMRDNFA